MSAPGVNPEGGRRRRVTKLVDGVQKHLEAGETVREVVQVQTGESAAETAGAIATLAGPGTGPLPDVTGSFALMATETRVYVTPLKGPTLTKVQEPVVTVPIEEAELEWLGDRIVLQGKSFHVMWLFGRRAKSFVEFVRRSED